MSLTDKSYVLARYPHAYAYQWAGTNAWCIYATQPGDADHKGAVLASNAETMAAAWTKAAISLQLKGK
jgi:hypothetical protein